MNRFKKLMICGVCVCLASQTAFATRYMQSKQQNTDNVQAQSGESEVQDDALAKLPFNDQQDWANMYFNKELPGTNTDLFKGYTFDGEQIEPPTFDLYKSFSADQISNISDAIVDYRGWDAVLGATSYNFEEKSIDFKVAASGTAPEKTFGYGIKKFGCEEYEFDFKIEGVEENWSDGFIGFGLLTAMTQAPNWQTGVSGYLVLFRGTGYEFQRYPTGQQIVMSGQTDVMSPNEWHRVKISIVKDGDKKIISTTVDGEEVFTYTDEKGSELPDEGYFNLVSYAGTKLSLRAVNPTIEQSINGEGESAISGAVALKIGNDKAVVSGKVVPIDAENENVVPYTEADRTLVPVRFIAENLGAFVSYEEENKRAILAFDECNIEFTEGFAEYKLDDDWHISECKAEVQHDRMFVPARIIAEAVGKTVDYKDGYVFISDKALTAEEQTELMNLLK